MEWFYGAVHNSLQLMESKAVALSTISTPPDITQRVERNGLL